MMKKITLLAALIMANLSLQAATPKQDDYYKFTRIPLPEGVVLLSLIHI